MAVLALLCVWAGLIAAPASAADRYGVAGDPQEAAPTLDGSPRVTDIERVVFASNNVGAITVIVRFYEALPSDSGYQLNVSASSTPSYPSKYSPGYCNQSASGDPTLHGYVGREGSSNAASTLTVTGYGASSPATRTVSADNRELTFTVSNPALAGRDYRCFTARMFRPDPDGHCAPSNYNCNYIAYSYTIDELNPIGYFGGFEPKPLPQCYDGIDNDGDTAVDWPFDQDCADENGRSEATPPKPPRPPLPPLALTKTKAGEYLRTALKRKYGRRYSKRRRGSLRTSCKKADAARYACKVSWAYKRYRYRGKVTVQAKYRGRKPTWVYKTKIKRAAVRQRKRARAAHH